MEEFYLLARAALVKDERHLDRFDRVFGTVFKGIETLGEATESTAIPEEWLRKLAEKYLTDAEKAELKSLGWDKLFETLKQRLAEQKETPSGRQQVDRYRGNLTVRRLWLQPRRHPHRPGRQPEFSRGEGVGQARIQGSR